MDYKLLTMFKLLFEKISPKKFYYFATSLIPWAFLFSVIFIGYGLYLGLFRAPTDYQQGDAFRIIYVHVPSAWLSLFAYTSVFICSLISIIWKIKVFEVLSIASAKNGAMFTFLALVTGSIWGKPMWGTWWVWDARLTSELILLFLYLAYMSLNSAFDNPKTAAKASSILAIVGLINLPIIHYSVKWWNTLHQGYSVGTGGLKDPDMQIALAIMFIASIFLYALLVAIKARTEVLVREQNSRWVKDEVEGVVS